MKPTYETARRLALSAGLLLTICTANPAAAQTNRPDSAPPQPAAVPEGGNQAGQAPQGQLAPGQGAAQQGIFTLQGKVMDGTTNQPIPFATIAVLRPADSTLVTGGLADDEGNFSVDRVPPGSYLVRTGFIGYGNDFRLVQVSPEQPVAALGNIVLSQRARRLNEVVVEAERPVMQLGIDRKTFDVSRSNLNIGGSASDVLGNIPTVTVDQDGNVSLRNNENVTIYIDGRPSGITAQNRAAILQQIPASQIERIELITSPSARYDAEGVSGIINIILKKNRMEGFNGSVQAGIANRGKHNAAANIAYRNRWANAYANYNYRLSNRFVDGWLNRTTWNRTSLAGERFDSTFTWNRSSQNDRDLNHAFKVGSDFTLPRNQILGFSVGLTTNDELETENTYYDIREIFAPYQDTATGQPVARRVVNSVANRGSRAIENDLNQDYTLSYRKRFDDKGHELILDGSYANYRNDNFDVFRQKGILPGQSSKSFVNFPFQEVRNDIVTKSLIGQLDYIRPMASGFKLETGLKNTNREITSLFRYYASETAETGLPEVLPQRNDFTFRENTLAGYLMGSRQWEKWGAQLGVRVERTEIGGSSEFLDSLNAEVSRGIGQTPYWFVSPTLNLSYKLNRTNEFQFSFTRRINRPGREQLNPFTDYTDPTSLRSGNPSVGPEKILALEGTWQYSPGQSTISTTAFFRHTSDLLTRTIFIVSPGVSQVYFDNAGTRNDYGLEVVSRIVPFRKFSITGSGALFGSQINSPFNTNGGVRNNLNYNFRILANYQLPTATNLQLTSGYRSPFILPQGRSVAFYNTDVAVTQDFLKGKLQAGLTVNDIFNTLRFGIETAGDNFMAEMDRKRETRFVTFSLTYRFGSMDNLSRRRDRNRGEGGEGGGDMMF